MERAVAFYSLLLGMSGESIAPTRHYFHCGGTILALVDPSGHDGQFRPNTEVVYFAVEDLKATQRRAQEAGCQPFEGDGIEEQGIATRPWGERSFYVRDPFGNPICFVDEQTLFTGRDASSE